jgi:hypothetical protein
MSLEDFGIETVENGVRININGFNGGVGCVTISKCLTIDEAEKFARGLVDAIIIEKEAMINRRK